MVEVKLGGGQSGAELETRHTVRRVTQSWLLDMHGVLAREENPIPGADRFLARLRELGLPFLVLTNNSMYTRRDLSARLRANGLEAPEHAIWTSALATARFLEEQRDQHRPLAYR
jgi:NagD protein